MIAIGVLALGVVATFVWPRAEGPSRALPTGPAPPCPFGFIDQLGRREAIVARLRETEEGTRILGALGETEVRYCFGDIDVPVVSEDRLLLLTLGADDDALAARAAHLLTHVLHGSPLPEVIPPGSDCDRVVRQALRSEARAYAVEVRLRRELGVEETLYEFEPTYWQSEDGERAIFEYLLAHPEGGPGLDPLGDAYRERCEETVRRRR